MMAIIVPSPHHLRQHVNYRRHYLARFRGSMGGDLAKHSTQEAKIRGDPYSEPASPLPGLALAPAGATGATPTDDGRFPRSSQSHPS